MTNLNNVNWVDRLIYEYTEGRKALRIKHESLSNSEVDKIDKGKINSMINEMSEVIKWLKIGKDPNTFRGNDRRSAYQRGALIDMDLFPSLDILPKERELTDEEREQIYNILIDLSWRERQCYLLHFANLRSYSEIAKELNLSKSSVQSYINRAKEKVYEKVSCHTDAV